MIRELIPVELSCGTYELRYDCLAMQDMADQYGQEKIFDLYLQNTAQGTEVAAAIAGACSAAASRYHKAFLRDEGGPVLTAGMAACLRPLDMVTLKAGLTKAIMAGYNRDIADNASDEERDAGLEELNKSKNGKRG